MRSSDRHRIGRADRLGVGRALRRGGLRRDRPRERHARALLRRRTPPRRHTTERLLDALPRRRSARVELDIRDADGVDAPVRRARRATIELVIHTAAQPSHDWAASDPQTDFAVNANGTLNLLEATRRHSPDATFVFRSTNKVYGDLPNSLPLVELETRLELPADHRYHRGIDTTMSIDDVDALAVRRLQGGSRPARAGVRALLRHAHGVLPRRLPDRARTTPGTQLHGFLSYLMRCTVTGEPYTVFGYGGKQVRDNIHSRRPGARRSRRSTARRARRRSTTSAAAASSNCSMLEAIELCEQIAGRELDWQPRRGRPGSATTAGGSATSSQFRRDYPDWEHPLRRRRTSSHEIHDRNAERWVPCRVKLSVVIPAHDEARVDRRDRGARSHAELEREEVDYEILVVDDASSDGTGEVVAAIAAADPGVRCIRSPRPPGFGHAVRAGLDEYSGDAVAIVMADLSDSPRDLVRYLRRPRGGLRLRVRLALHDAAARVYDYPRLKLVLNRIVNLGIRVLFRHGYNDTTNAFKAYRREVIDHIQPLLSNHFNLTVEMPLKAIVRGHSYAVVPISWTNRAHGVSKLKLQEMGSRYLFIVLYVFLEHHLSRGDYRRPGAWDARGRPHPGLPDARRPGAGAARASARRGRGRALMAAAAGAAARTSERRGPTGGRPAAGAAERAVGAVDRHWRWALAAIIVARRGPAPLHGPRAVVLLRRVGLRHPRLRRRAALVARCACGQHLRLPGGRLQGAVPPRRLESLRRVPGRARGPPPVRGRARVRARLAPAGRARRRCSPPR